MQATISTAGIYDHLLPHSEKAKVSRPMMPPCGSHALESASLEAVASVDNATVPVPATPGVDPSDSRREFEAELKLEAKEPPLALPAIA